MCNKEELAKKYSFNIPSEIYNTLETYADKFLWKSEIERAFEAGWDAAINKACEWLKFYYTGYLNSSRLGIDIDEMVKDFKMDMKGE